MLRRLFLIIILAAAFLIPLGEAEADVFYRDKVVVLLYHDISEARKNSATMPPKLFREHMEVLGENFNVISLEDVVAFHNGQKSVPPNAVAITFDDGYSSNYEQAFPILNQFNWPATVFLTVEAIGKVNPTLAWLTWSQIAEMASGGITFGSHSATHGLIGRKSELVEQHPGESQQDYENRVTFGLDSSYQTLMDHGLKTTQFAAPYGQYNQILKNQALKVGYKHLWGVDSYPVVKGCENLSRIDVGAFWTSPEALRERIVDTASKIPPD